MEKCNYNNHLFLLNSRQKEIFNYFNNLKKPPCPNCTKNNNVVKIIYSNLGKSLQKVFKTTGAIKLSGQQSKISNWICKKCGCDF